MKVSKYMLEKYLKIKKYFQILERIYHSFTPAHEESKYYNWEDKHVTNFSVDLNDEYTFESKK